MNKNFLKKWLLGFSLVASVAYTVIYACSDSSWSYDIRDNSNFTPEAYVDKLNIPLFFLSWDYEFRYSSRFNDDIVADWNGYLDGKINKTDLEYFILEDSAKVELANLYEVTFKKKKSEFPSRNIDLNNKKVKSFIEFMQYAKQIERYTTNGEEVWDFENDKAITLPKELVRQVTTKFEQTQDDFLKNRYWFQAMKANFYSSSKSGTIAFFEKTKNQVPQNTLYYRGLAYIAGIYYQEKKYAKSNYLYAVVFEKCPVLREVMLYNFHPQEQADFDMSLQMTQNNDEKVALWTMLGYYADEHKAIEKVYQLNPKSEHLDFLLVYLIQKEEERLRDESYKSVSEYKKKMKAKLDKKTVALIDRIVKEGQTAKPYLWEIAAGYLSTFNGDYKRAEALFKNAEAKAPKTELSQKQVRLLKWINTLCQQTKINANVEKVLLPEMKWLREEVLKKSDGNPFRTDEAMSWSRNYISLLYKEQKNDVMAELFSSDANFYKEEKKLEAMKTFLTKPDKNGWEQLTVSMYTTTLPEIYEYQAVNYTYANKIEQAIGLMEKAENGKDVALLGNPFNGKIKDCNDCDHAAPQKIKYTKLSFLQKIKEMQDKIAQSEDIYSNSLLLGNAFYNLAYYGNARLFYAEDLGGRMESYEARNSSKPYLLDQSLAYDYYKKAYAAADNPEQKAKCLFMMAKCERNTYYNKACSNPIHGCNELKVQFLAWDGFKKLKADYSNTQYYKDVIRECGYFRKYAK